MQSVEIFVLKMIQNVGNVVMKQLILVVQQYHQMLKQFKQ
ncbi:unnamed protein product [Trichobilharzia regenti]|nr:unnamed protein product [Trichobilharzia regenti]